MQARCDIYPQPPLPFQYFTWTVLNSVHGLFIGSDKNITINVNFDLYHSGFIYCTISFGSFDLTGYKRVSINGKQRPSLYIKLYLASM